MSKFKRHGDKKNSPYFEEYLKKIYQRRDKSGISDLIKKIAAVLVQVENGQLLNYLAELYLMTPYRFYKGFITTTHRVVVLRNTTKTPDYIILEPLSPHYHDCFTSLNHFHPRSKEILQARYLGEIYQTTNLQETVKTLESQEFRFQENIPNAFLSQKNLAVSEISYFTNNVICYTDSDLTNYQDFKFEKNLELSSDEQTKLAKVDSLQQEFGITSLILGLDHLATRVLTNDREHALLEFLSMSNYYFWGAYDIEEMNSSTNICRNPNIKDETISPAKVFTASNTPFYTNSITKLASPTEDFVRNFGKRMHHLAYAITDGAQPDGMKNIDYVVSKLHDENIAFLAKVIGECRDFPDLKQIFSKHSKHSLLITEYVQRCHGFEGFFTKNNVSALTEAAGDDETLRDHAVCD